MKRIITAMLLILCIGIMGALDLESYEFMDYLLSLNGPQAPVIFQDAVIFTASSSFRRVGISFAHDSFSKVHWLQRLLIHRDSAETAAENRRNADPYRDSGILFHVEIIPEGIENMDYRMVIDGLWTVDPLNSHNITGAGGIQNSRVMLPVNKRPPSSPPPGTFRFMFNAPPGERITIGGSFNNWDPFMYEMRETGTGIYALTLDLPPGIYEYVFFYRGERFTDPNNPNRVYTKDGKTASQAIIR